MTLILTKASASKLNEIPTSVLYYGSSGTGKTWFAGTAGSRQLYIDVGSSRRTLLSKGFKEKVGSDPFIHVVTEDVGKSGIPKSAEAFDRVTQAIDDALASPEILKEIDTITVDDATFLRRAALYKALEFNQSTGQSQSLNKAQAHDLIKAAVQDYGVEMDYIDQFLAYYNEQIKDKYGKNFILLAHERVVTEKPKDAKGNTIIGGLPIIRKVQPGFTGEKFPDKVPAYFDWVFHAEPIAAANKTLYRCRTSTDGIVTAKNRDDSVFPMIIDNPHFGRMIQQVKESMK